MDFGDRVIVVTIEKILNSITEQLIHQIFDPYGLIDRLYLCQSEDDGDVQVVIWFQSARSTTSAKTFLQGRNKYAGCCQLDIKFYSQRSAIAEQTSSTPDQFSDFKSVNPSKNVEVLSNEVSGDEISEKNFKSAMESNEAQNQVDIVKQIKELFHSLKNQLAPEESHEEDSDIASSDALYSAEVSDDVFVDKFRREKEIEDDVSDVIDDFVSGDHCRGTYGPADINAQMKFRVNAEIGHECLLANGESWAAHKLFVEMLKEKILVRAYATNHSRRRKQPQQVGHHHPPWKPPWKPPVNFFLLLLILEDKDFLRGIVCNALYGSALGLVWLHQ